MKFAILLLTALFFADPFWVMSPQEWTPEELNLLLADSPWAHRLLSPPGGVPFPEVQSFLATAGPIQQGEAELKRREELRRPPGDEPDYDPFAEEYEFWLEDFGDSQVILAIRISDPDAFSDNAELDRLEEDSSMRLAGRKVKMTGYFPPSSHDPFLRIAFPKDLSRLKLSGNTQDIAKTLEKEKLSFELYVPGISGPFREVEYPLKDMLLDGELEL